MKLRLLLWEECNRNCIGCCNKYWNLNTLPVETEFDHYDKIILTGGELMLYPDLLIDKINEIREQTNKPIIIYTAKVEDIFSALNVLYLIDGMTLTLHDRLDIIPFVEFNTHLENHYEIYHKKSLRLNIFKEVGDIKSKLFPLWKIKDNIEWIENCPLPKDEIFCRATKP